MKENTRQAISRRIEKAINLNMNQQNNQSLASIYKKKEKENNTNNNNNQQNNKILDGYIQNERKRKQHR